MRKMSRKQSLVLLGFLLAFVIIQFALFMDAVMQKVIDQYKIFILFQMILGIGGMCGVWKYTGQKAAVRLVLWAVTLLSIGQLIQSILQRGEAYESYTADFLLFLTAAALLSVLLCFCYRFLYRIMTDPRGMWLLILLSIACIGVLVLFGAEQNGAKLWINLGVMIQLTEPLKIIFIFAACSIICITGRLSLFRQIGLLVFSGGTAVCVAGILNEFGTGLLLGLTGIFLLYLFSSESAKIPIAIGFAGTGLLLAFFLMYGYWVYRQVPLEVSNEIFGEQFSAAADRKTLANLLREHGNEIQEEARGGENGENMAPLVVQMDMDGFVQFLEEELTDEEVSNADSGNMYSEEEFPEAAQRQQKYMNQIAVLAGSETFRDLYNDYFISADIYADNVLKAYREYCSQLSGVEAALKKGEGIALKIYIRGMDKLKDKFSGFFHPDEEALSNAYQINKGMESMETGGFFGNGPEVVLDRQVFASDSDLVFAMIVSELGGVFGIAVIVLNMLILREALEISMLTASWYQKGISIAVGSMWFLQAMIIIAGNCRWMPLTGITLPLVATGGSSLAISIVSIVLLVLIAARPVPEYWYGKSGSAERTSGKKRKWFGGFSDPYGSYGSVKADDSDEVPDTGENKDTFQTSGEENTQYDSGADSSTDKFGGYEEEDEKKPDEKAKAGQETEEWEGFCEDD